MPRRPAAVLLAAVLAVACTAGAPPTDDGAAIDGRTLYVTDGDTVRLPGGERVRLAGIDTPELPPRSKCDHETKLALEAKARLLELVRSADQVTLHKRPGERDRDRYDRLLRDLHIDGRDAGDTLVDEGLARPWRGRREPWC